MRIGSVGRESAVKDGQAAEVRRIHTARADGRDEEVEEDGMRKAAKAAYGQGRGGCGGVGAWLVATLGMMARSQGALRCRPTISRAMTRQ